MLQVDCNIDPICQEYSETRGGNFQKQGVGDIQKKWQEYSEKREGEFI